MVFDRSAAEAAFSRRLLPIARRWRGAADIALSEIGLSDANGWVLVHISRMDEGVHQSALAEMVDIKGASLVRRLDQLEAAGLVTRITDPQDRRANHVRLTAHGKALAGRIEQAFSAIRGRLLADIDDADLAIANMVLDRVDGRIAGTPDNEA